MNRLDIGGYHEKQNIIFDYKYGSDHFIVRTPSGFAVPG